MNANDPSLSNSEQSSAPPVRTFRLSSVKQKLVNILVGLLTVSDERKQMVLEDVTAGSVPRFIYYVLLGVSVLIAGFGLLANSPAVVIGAMLVSPLMTPIFGISVALSRGDMRLLRNALASEFGGVLLAIGLAFVLGKLPFSLEATPEMLARTSPTLLDLFVAALAGLAGCLAMIDERISPALPGVAIATSLTPPLATSGLSLAFGAYAGAWGAFLLFFANFLAILAVSTAIFISAGFFKREEIGSTVGFIGRFAAAGIGLVIVAVLLTHHLLGIIRDWHTTRTINTVLETELAREPSTSLEKAFYHREDDGIDVLSMVRASHVLSPPKVKRIEDALVQRLKQKVRLFIRASITKDVTAGGATNLLTEINLNGNFTKRVISPAARVETIAEQAVREILADIPNVALDDIDLINLPAGPVVVVSIQSPRTPLPVKVQLAEEVIQKRVGDPRVRLLVRTIESSDISSTGPVLLGEAHFGVRTAEEIALQNTIEQQVKREIEKIPNLFVPSADAVKDAHGWVVRAEVVGPRVLDPKEVQAVEKTLFNVVGQPLELTVWARTDLIVTGQRYFSMQGYREATAPQPPQPAETQVVPEKQAGAVR